jgi:hypothetical protein
MGNIQSPDPVKLFVGLLTSLPDASEEIQGKLTALFGPIDSISELYQFDFTHYYDDEMGTPIFRQFFGFSNLIDPAAIAGIKVKTNELELEFSGMRSNAPRPVNLDPGYLEQSKIVLASTKNFYHRILISGGIYAEVTLHYAGKSWRSFPWTFPDYKSDRYHAFFYSLRDAYRKQLNDTGVRVNLGLNGAGQKQS